MEQSQSYMYTFQVNSFKKHVSQFIFQCSLAYSFINLHTCSFVRIYLFYTKLYYVKNEEKNRFLQSKPSTTITFQTTKQIRYYYCAFFSSLHTKYVFFRFSFEQTAIRERKVIQMSSHTIYKLGSSYIVNKIIKR